MLGVTVIEENAGGRSELGAWDSATGQAMTIVGGGSWPSGPEVVAAAFSQDGQWLYALASDGTLRRQWVAGHGHRPDWVGDAARALTGYRSVGNTALEPLDGATLAKVRTRAVALAREAERGGDVAAGFVLRALERIENSEP
jgi:hypothetical protein